MVPTPRTRFLRPFTTRVINPITRLVAGRLPGFAIVSHVGRTSGRVYRTPVNVFRRGPDYVFALTYGSDVHWVANILAAAGCEIEIRGRKVQLTAPRIVVDLSRSLMPFPVRQFLGLMRVSEFLILQPLPAT
jgi:deazaflavin-dependent oxidoreductase (nitroreductase family)